MKRASKKNASPVGLRGKVLFGVDFLPVVVVEDRGFIGANGRQLFRVRRDDPNEDPGNTFEIPAEAFVPSRA